MSTVLITGSEGNIGRYIVKRLKEQYPDFNIIRISHTSEIHPGENEKVYIGDLCDADFVCSIFAKNSIDYVIHAAGSNYNIQRLKSEPFQIISNDIFSLLNTLKYSKDIKKFVYLSSATVYEGSDKVPFTEDLTQNIEPPKSPYGLAKFFGEKAVESFSKENQIPFTIWRAFNVVSPLEPHDKDGAHVFVDFYRRIFIEQSSAIEIFGSGSQVRCFTWVEDLVQGIIDNLNNQESDNQIFNIGSDEQTTLTELVDIFIKIGKDNNFLPKEYSPSISTGKEFGGIDSAQRVPDVSKVKKKLGWKYSTKAVECFEKFIIKKQENGS